MPRQISLRFTHPLILALVLAAPSLAEEDLRQCTNADCRRYALSDTWQFCPYCGTRLPDVVVRPALKDEVVGNIFRSAQYGFQVELPNEKWSFLLGQKLADELNADATVGMESKSDVYSMVIAERMPRVALDQYMNLVAPSLEGRRTVSQQEVEVPGAEALRVKWVGTLNDIPFHFYQLLVAYGDTRLQVVSWLVAGNDNEENQAEIAAIEKSFRVLPSQ